MIIDDDNFKEIEASDLNEDFGTDIEAQAPETTVEPEKSQDSTVTVQPVQFASFEDLDQVLVHKTKI